MASQQAIRLRRADADRRIKAAADALAEELGVNSPNYVVRRSYPGNLKEAMVQEETATLLEAVADKLGIDMPRGNQRRPYPISVNPDENDSIIETDDPEENTRRQEDAARRYQGIRVQQGLEKADIPAPKPPVQRMDTTHPAQYDPANSAERRLATGDVELEPDPGAQGSEEIQRQQKQIDKEQAQLRREQAAAPAVREPRSPRQSRSKAAEFTPATADSGSATTNADSALQPGAEQSGTPGGKPDSK